MEKTAKLYETVAALMTSGRGIIAADESDATAGKRLALVNLPNEPEHRQKFRELIFTAAGIEEYVSGVIMFDSSIRNTTHEGMPFPDVLLAKGIIPGIKVDLGTQELHGFTGEVVTQGLDNLEQRLAEYYNLGARFTKWRAVYSIGDTTPTRQCLKMNAIMLARYTQLVQAAGLVPIVEPEVLLNGNHSLERAEQVTTQVLHSVFSTFIEYEIDLSAVILKSSMVLAGDTHPKQSTPEEVASATLRTFSVSVPESVGGIVFLSGGQTPRRATENLQAVALLHRGPWPITFSYSRAIEEPMLATWQGKPEHETEAQKMLLHTCKMNSLAQQGAYDSKKDKKLPG